MSDMRRGGRRRGGDGPTTEEIVNLASFIAWHENNDVHACVVPLDAFETLAKLVDIPTEKLFDIVRGSEDWTDWAGSSDGSQQ